MKAVILVGGEGTRLRPLTLNRPKPMVPILNRPFLEHMINYLNGHGIDDIILALCYLPDHIQKYFGDGSDFGVRLTCVTESPPLGTAGAVKNVEQHLDETFFVFNGDVFTDLDLTRMMEFHQERRAKVTIALTPVENPSIYGVVEADANSRVERFVEKPSPDAVTTNMINAGIYIIEPGALESIPSQSFCMFEREVFPKLVETGDPVYSYASDAYWIDIGSHEKYLKLHYDLLRGKTAKSFPSKGIQVDGDCDIHSKAELKGPIIIGTNCVIGPRVQVKGPSVIGPNCHIGADSIVDGAVVWENTNFGQGVSARECVIAENVHVGDRSQIMKGAVLGDNVVVGAGKRIDRDTKLGADDPLYQPSNAVLGR